ncbi:hypothetical protein Taro_025959 [Colocasia esculenta]|uniref:Uncharacterized protein n=1 Tax=Colocasia esculenta TaxID=4460 RepID=A0A843VPV4_COLES|nr:hypothetical protein [Colocasia esculenta]
MGSSGVVYETLGPLFLSQSTDLSEQYAVFRSEIGSSTCVAATVRAVDYFSLNASVEEADQRRDERPEGSPSPQTTSRIPEEKNQKPEGTWFRSSSRFRSSMVQLHKEILDFCDFISPTSEEQASRDAAVQRVSEVVILNSKVKTPQMGLSALARAISRRSVGKKIQVIAKARVPIIKFVEKQSGIAFDLSFDMQSGPNAADFIKDSVMKMPALRPLCLILKVFLQQRELNEVFLGGIGSYALIAMLIAHLQMHWRGQNLPSWRIHEHNLGVLLVDFFDFYGRKLNNWHVGVSCSIPGNFFVKSSRGVFLIIVQFINFCFCFFISLLVLNKTLNTYLNDDRPYLLSIEDPQDPDNDIGRNSYNYFKVKSAFATAASSLTDANTILGLGPLKSILGTIIRPDAALLQRKGGSKGDLTFNSLLPGAGEPGTSPFANGGDLLCNWQLMDEEPLPRRTPVLDDGLTPPKKRKILKSKHRTVENGNSKIANTRDEGASGKREKRTKRQHQKGYRDEEWSIAGRSAQNFRQSPWSH